MDLLAVSFVPRVTARPVIQSSIRLELQFHSARLPLTGVHSGHLTLLIGVNAEILWLNFISVRFAPSVFPQYCPDSAKQCPRSRRIWRKSSRTEAEVGHDPACGANSKNPHGKNRSLQAGASPTLRAFVKRAGAARFCLPQLSVTVHTGASVHDR